MSYFEKCRFFYELYEGVWSVKHSLPLHLCRISFIIGIFNLWNPKQWMFEWCLFLSIPAGFQAILTPEVPMGEGNWLLVDYYFSHASIIFVPLYLSIVMKMNPRKHAWIKMFLYLQVVALICFPLNYIFDSNLKCWEKGFSGNSFDITNLQKETWIQVADGILVTILDEQNTSLAQYNVDNGKMEKIFDHINTVGQETYVLDNGDKYEGDWKNGEPHGQGTFIWANGDKYIGVWKDGDMHGQGTFTIPDGIKYVGVWKNAEPWNGIRYDKNGNIEGNFVNGVFQEENT